METVFPFVPLKIHTDNTIWERVSLSIPDSIICPSSGRKPSNPFPMELVDSRFLQLKTKVSQLTRIDLIWRFGQ